MATVSVRVPDELKERMDELDEINWSAVLREHIKGVLDNRRDRDLAHAVLTSERLSQDIDPSTVTEQDTTEVIRQWRSNRFGPGRGDDDR